MDGNILSLIRPGEVYAIIPARSGSKGVKDKNIRPLAGYPMMAYSIAAARLCPGISRILVSTDSERYAAIARYYGAEAPFIRPTALADDHSTDIDFMAHAITWLAGHEQAVPELFVHLRPTCPVREVSVVAGAIQGILSDPGATSLRSAHRASFAPYKWFTMGEQGYFQCLFDGMQPDEANNPRQGFPPVYIPDGYVDVLRTSFIVKEGLLHGPRVHAYVVPEGTDVDTPREMRDVEMYMEGKHSELYEYLKEHYRPMEEIGL